MPKLKDNYTKKWHQIPAQVSYPSTQPRGALWGREKDPAVALRFICNQHWGAEELRLKTLTRVPWRVEACSPAKGVRRTHRWKQQLLQCVVSGGEQAARSTYPGEEETRGGLKVVKQRLNKT